MRTFFRNLGGTAALTLLAVLFGPGMGGADGTGFDQYKQRILEEIETRKQAIREDPDNPTGYFKLGLSYLALGRHREEIAAYEEAVRLKPDYAEAHYNLGVAYDLFHKGKAAIRHTLQAQRSWAKAKNQRQVLKAARRLRVLYQKYDYQPRDFLPPR